MGCTSVDLRALGGGINRELGIGAHLLHAPDGKHPAPTRLGHTWQGDFENLERCPEVDVDLKRKLLQRDLDKGAARLSGRVQHHDVDGAEIAKNPLDKLPARPLYGEICSEPGNPRLRKGADTSGRVAGLLRCPAMNGHRRAPLGESLRDGPSDAAARPCNQGCAAGEIEWVDIHHSRTPDPASKIRARSARGAR